MKISKKVLGVLLALSMLINIFALFSTAAAPESAIDLSLRLDKETYAPGDIVTVTVSEKVEAEVGDMRVGGSYGFGYDNSVIELIDTSQSDSVEPLNFVAIQQGVDLSMTGIMYTDSLVGMGATIDEGKGWNTITNLNIGDDLTTTFDATGGVDLFTFQMKIQDNAADGEYTIGFNKGSYVSCAAYSNDATMGGVYGEVTPEDSSSKYYSTDYNYSYGMTTFKVSSAPAGPSVVKSAGQIKMTATSATTVEDAFQLRIISKITSADWDANFANTGVNGATANYITKVGMVAYTGTADAYTLDDAKAAITAGASNGNYYYGETDYINHAEGGDATFGTILKCTHGSDKLQNDPICLGFVKYVDADGQEQVIVYPETYTAPIVSNYDTIASNYARDFFGK